MTPPVGPGAPALGTPPRELGTPPHAPPGLLQGSIPSSTAILMAGNPPLAASAPAAAAVEPALLLPSSLLPGVPPGSFSWGGSSTPAPAAACPVTTTAVPTGAPPAVRGAPLGDLAVDVPAHSGTPAPWALCFASPDTILPGYTAPSGAAFAKKPAVPVRAAAPAQRGVYAAAPVLKRPVPEATSDVLPGPGAKRSAVTASPAAQRAAAAKAERADQAPVWLYKDGQLSQAGAGRIAEPGAALGHASAQAAPSASEAVQALKELPLPPGWVIVPHEDECYYWNTETNEVSWEHPLAPASESNVRKGRKDLFREEHRVLWTDLGRIIGRQGINLKIIKASIGCNVKVPRQKGGGKSKGKGTGKDPKGKGKGKPEIRRGIGTGEKLTDDQFATLVFEADTANKAYGGKRCVEVMLGYGRNVERALCDLGCEVKMPSLEEMAGDKAIAATKDGVDPMDPAAYSDAPVGAWSAGMPKRDACGRLVSKRAAPEPRDSSSANAERF